MDLECAFSPIFSNDDFVRRPRSRKATFCGQTSERVRATTLCIGARAEILPYRQFVCFLDSDQLVCSFVCECVSSRAAPGNSSGRPSRATVVFADPFPPLSCTFPILELGEDRKSHSCARESEDVAALAVVCECGRQFLQCSYGAAAAAAADCL